MSHKTRISLLMLPVLLGACSFTPPQNPDTQLSGTDSSLSWMTISWADSPSVDEEQDPADNHHYIVSFEDTQDVSKTITINHEWWVQDTVSFVNTGYQSMDVSIAFTQEEWLHNYRLSQIIMPDGSMDGPFGRDTSYDLTQEGEYQLIFGESLMQGDRRTGEALITINLHN